MPPRPQGLAKQIVSWPLVGGLQTKQAPLVQQPGSFLQLDNVRQERAGEWKNRRGLVHNTADDMPQQLPALRGVELPGGGVFAQVNTPFAQSSARFWSPSVPSSSHWTIPNPFYAPQCTPGVWSRRSVGYDKFPIYLQSMAVGNGYRLIAWKPGNASAGDQISYTLVSDAEGEVVIPMTSIGLSSVQNPVCVYAPSQGILVLLYLSQATNTLVGLTFNATTGAPLLGATVIVSNVAGLGSTAFMDAIVYSGSSTITVVYRKSSFTAVILEVNPSTLVASSNVDTAVNCDSYLGLLPDPDGSGVRFMALSTGPGVTRVLRLSNVGAILTNDVAENVNASQIAGCAYESGASWMIVYTSTTGGGSRIRAVKKRSGVVSAATPITPDTGIFLCSVDTNAWRESGSDAMRYIAGIHVGGGGGSAGDFQSNYYEMALEFENGSANVGNFFSEPQGRLIPLNAGPGAQGNGTIPQVSRIAANHYALPLTRLSKLELAAGVQQNQFAVDQWDVSYLSIANVGTPSFLFPNLGPGLKGSQASYLPAAQLLQTVNGQTVCGHGESAVPYGVSPSLTAGGSLTSGAKYQWMVSVDMPDENGNVWRSPAGLPSTQITPSAGNLSVSIVIRVSPFECGARKRVIKLWRTSGNGFVFQLVKELTDFAGANATITVSDGLADTALAGSSFYPFALPGQAGGELPPTITPAASHIEQFDGRMFIVDRDFPSRVRYTKPIAQGISPEFPDEFQINIVDSDGDITGLQALDDKLVIRKLGAVYIVPAGGPNNDGSGTFYQALRVSSTVGSVSGTPAVSTGEENWFFSQFGVYRMNRSLGIDFVGEPVDQFFNQPQIFFPDVPLSMTFNHAANQIRILTTSFRLIYDTIHQVWHRDIFPGDDRGGSGYTMFMIETAQGDMFFRATGEVWFDTADDGASTTTDPNGVLVSGLIRSPWMRPADVEGWVRLYEARSVYLKGPNGGLTAFPQMLVYANNGEGGTDTGARSGTTNPTEQRLAFRPKGAPKVSAFSIAVQLPGGDQSWRLDLWTVLVGVGKRGMAKLSPAQRLASQ